MINYTYIYLLPTILLLIISLYSIYKIRKIHLATYSLQEDVSASRREIEVLFSQIQALLALERKLMLSEALPAMRGWAGSPDFLLVVADEVLDRKPSCVMECSSGISTLVVARCLQMIGSGHVFSLEHDLEYAEKTRSLLERYGLADWATVIHAPLQKKSNETPWYSEEAIPFNLPAIEMLIVDGPPHSTGALARFPALPRLMSRLSEKCIIILDDASRKDEVEMVEKWKELVPQLTINQRFCEKGLVLLSF